MPSAVPNQLGLIGAYNNAASINPGVYISWDLNTNFNSVYSVIFRGYEGNNYLFPLVVHKCTANGSNVEIGSPIAIGAGNTYIYTLTNNYLIAYQKVADTFSTIAALNTSSIQPGLVPNSLQVNNLNGVEFVTVGYSQGYFDILTLNNGTFSQSTGLAYSSICGLTTNYYPNYDLALFNNKIYFSYLSNVYAADISLGVGNTLVVGAGTTGIIINSSNGLVAGRTVYNIAVYANDKLALSDNYNNVYEFTYLGNPNSDNSTSQWAWSNQYVPTNNPNFNSLAYNSSGAIMATDSNNHQLSIISNGLQALTFGGKGYSYQQFNTPTCVTADPAFNVIVGDLNNRLTYIPTNVTYVGIVDVPQTEYIDYNGSPTELYYIKQSTYNFDKVQSLIPLEADELLIKASVLYELNALLRVPVYEEELLWNFGRQSGTLAYGDIVTTPDPQVRISTATNQGQNSPTYVLNPYQGYFNTLDQSTDSPFDAPVVNNNYPNGLYYRFTSGGKLYFFDMNGNPVSVQEYDIVTVTYYVKMFTNAQINNALYLSLQTINARPGLNKISSPAACPFWYDSTLIVGACFYLIRQLLVGLNSRERRLLVQDPESGSFDAFSNLKEMAKMYQDEYDKLLKTLPLAVRPTMGTITVPEYAMPGSRTRLFRQLFTTSQN